MISPRFPFVSEHKDTGLVNASVRIYCAHMPFSLTNHEDRCMTFRILATAFLLVLLFTATDHVIDDGVNRWVAGSNFRFLAGSLDGLDELCVDLAASKDPAILFFGDSTVHGEAVPRGDQAAPFYFKKELDDLTGQPHRCVNMGLIGSPAQIHELLLRRMADTHPDQVFFFVNYRALKRSGEFSIYNNWLAPEKMRGDSVLEKSGARLGDFATSHWSLYRNRHWVFGRYIGAPPWRAVRNYFYLAPLGGGRQTTAQIFSQKGETTWTQRPWNPEAINRLRQTFAVPLLRRDQSNIAAIERVCRYAEQSDQKLTIIFPPMNTEMIEVLVLVDNRIRDRNVALINAIAAESGIEILDASNWIPDRYFADSVHMISEGNRIFGERLAHWYAKEPGETS